MPVGAGPEVLTFPGDMLAIFVPNWVNSASTKRWMPSPIDVNRMTAAMPTAMPSNVRKLRNRCAVMARSARRVKSVGNMNYVSINALIYAQYRSAKARFYAGVLPSIRSCASTQDERVLVIFK